MKFQLNIIGGAYFPVQRPDMAVVYTLGRKFHIDDTGLLVTEEGYWLFQPFVLMRIPAPYDEPLDINIQGLVSVFHSGSWIILGNILTYLYTYPEQLEDLGNGYFGNTPAAQPMFSGYAGEGGRFENVRIYYIPGGGKMHRPIAALDAPDAIGDFIVKARKIIEDMTNNEGGYFTNPVPALSIVTTDINLLETAEDTAKTHVAGSAAARDLKYDVVLRDLHGLQMYVQHLADTAEDVDTAIAIINSSGFDLKSHGVHTKDELKATNGKISGTVILTAKAVKGAGAYEWQIFTDVEFGWIVLPATVEANTKVKNLTPGITASFRCRAVKKTGATDWTQIVSVIVT
jgi:hypothetical protein